VSEGARPSAGISFYRTTDTLSKVQYFGNGDQVAWDRIVDGGGRVVISTDVFRGGLSESNSG
jgi:hypothetical protein